jgi:hypothetical protein
MEADPGAAALAFMTGFSEKVITAGFAGYLAVLLELIAAFSPAFCAPSPRLTEPQIVSPTTPGGRQSIGCSAQQQPAVTGSPTTHLPAHRPPTAGKSVARRLPAIENARPSITGWWTAGTVEAPDGRMQSTAGYDAYRQWCATRDIKPASHRTWGDFLKMVLNIETEVDDGRRTFYLGRVLRTPPTLVAVK